MGKAICYVLAEKAAQVIVADINLATAEEVCNALAVASDSGKHVAMQVDIPESSSVQTLFASIKDVYSTPASILVNCAGTFAPSASIVDTSEDTFDRIISVNLKGTFLMTKAAVQDMLAGGVTEGVVVNVSSLVGKTGWKRVCSYAASKAGIIGLTKTAALDLADKGIRCNAVLPGLTKAPDQRFLTEEQKQEISSRIPLGRLAQPSEVADVVVFLCSPESSYMTDTAVEVAGGCAL